MLECQPLPLHRSAYLPAAAEVVVRPRKYLEILQKTGGFVTGGGRSVHEQEQQPGVDKLVLHRCDGEINTRKKNEERQNVVHGPQPCRVFIGLRIQHRWGAIRDVDACVCLIIV